jgi:hypothetical protein
MYKPCSKFTWRLITPASIEWNNHDYFRLVIELSNLFRANDWSNSETIYGVLAWGRGVGRHGIVR